MNVQLKCVGFLVAMVIATKLKLVKLYRNENLENVHWPLETRIKHKSYCSDASGSSKEESDLHSEHPSIFMLYFNAMTRKYCYHIAKVTHLFSLLLTLSFFLR
jgi:hypothetical protein